ncbi:uncharacterized protein LOC109923135 [Rhincodon typus]|uniref:uncharacterized protein LOC109923135 n=1 Tax=Rhincodon typus TaxID=259920 RepID=UPI0020302762|nr:uncharacterized protein LOC109923135 [Rhincodon typus]
MTGYGKVGVVLAHRPEVLCKVVIQSASGFSNGCKGSESSTWSVAFAFSLRVNRLTCSKRAAVRQEEGEKEYQIMPAACDSLVEDIEDIVSAQDPKPHDQQFAKRNIIPHVRKRNKHKQDEGTEDLQADSVIPGAQKIWVKTWGCSHNSSDGEYMAGQLAVYGYKITDGEQCRYTGLWSDESVCSKIDFLFVSRMFLVSSIDVKLVVFSDHRILLADCHLRAG